MWRETDPVVSIRRDVPAIPVSAEERAEWNEALRIEEELGSAARFAGRSALAPFTHA